MRHRFFALLIIALLLVACGGSVEPSSTTSGAPSSGVVDKGESLAPNVPSGNGDGSALIVTSSLSLSVERIEAAILSARTVVTDAGGSLVGISRGSEAGGLIYRADGSLAAITDGPAYLTFRIPSAALERTTDALRSIGTLVGERTDATDVSASLRDLGARLKNLRAAEANYLRLLAQSSSVSDLLAVTAQLDNIRGQIEQLSAEQASLDDAVARSTLTLVLYPPATPIADATRNFDLATIAEEALGSLLAVGVMIATGGVYLLVFGLPLLVVALALYLLVYQRIIRRRRARRSRR